MKKLLSLLVFAAFAITANAQSPTFVKGDKVFTAGIGFGTALYSGSFYSNSLPPLSASLEFGVMDDFLTEGLTLGVAPYIGMVGSRYETTYSGRKYGWKYNYTVIGLRGAVHYPLVDNLDTYVGLMLGYNIVSAKEFGDHPTGLGFSASSSSASFSAYIGGRYYFSDNFAAMLELGYGVAYINLGVAIKF